MHDFPLKASSVSNFLLACLLSLFHTHEAKLKQKLYSSTYFAHIIKFLLAMRTINKLYLLWTTANTKTANKRTLSATRIQWNENLNEKNRCSGKLFRLRLLRCSCIIARHAEGENWKNTIKFLTFVVLQEKKIEKFLLVFATCDKKISYTWGQTTECSLRNSILSENPRGEKREQ